MTIGRTWLLEEHGDRPMSLNEHRRLHHRVWGAHNKATRHLWALLAREQHVPRLERAVITATPLHRDRRSPQDVGACAPHAKAAIDGLTDADVFADDDATHLVRLAFTAPDICGHNGLRLTIEELDT